MKDVLDMPMSVRCYNVLRNAELGSYDVETVRTALRSNRMLRTRCCGKKTLDEICKLVEYDPQKKDFYTLESIKKAFWETFHQAGEVYFGSTDKYTEEQWHEFVKYLGEEEG